MTRKKTAYRDFQEILLENLKDPSEAIAYLQAAFADEDERVILLALRDVLEARGGSIAELAEETHLNRQNLYRILSTKGNPRLKSLKTLLNAFGFEISIAPLKK
jgi:probable addiction module antidote protein